MQDGLFVQSHIFNYFSDSAIDSAHHYTGIFKFESYETSNYRYMLH